MLKILSHSILNSLIKHTQTIQTAAVTQSTVPFKNLIKDVFTENMKNEEFCTTQHSVIEEDIGKSVYLKQPFQKTVIKPLSTLKDPFLLVPLFKIHDSKGKPVNYKFFESIDLNRLFKLSSGEYFLQFPHTVELNVLSLEVQEIGRAVNLINPILSRKGILIFKEPDSDCAMIYLGIFINEEVLNTNNNFLGRLYKKYLFNDIPCFELLEKERIVLRLNLWITQDEYKFILGILGKNEEKHYYSFGLHPKMDLPSCDCTVTLSPALRDGQLVFEVHKSFDNLMSNGTPEGVVFVMDFNSSGARRFYEEFVAGIEEPMEEGDTCKDSDIDSGNDSDAFSCAVESD